jgi:hypothetical protein
MSDIITEFEALYSPKSYQPEMLVLIRARVQSTGYGLFETTIVPQITFFSQIPDCTRAVLNALHDGWF